MRAAVNGNAVGIGSEESFTNFLQVAATLVEDRNDAALRRNVKTTKALVKGEHIRICANRLNGRHFLCFKIKDSQFCIFLAGNECQTMLTVDVESVASAATGQRIASDELIFGRINLGQFILPMDGDKDVFGD